MSTLHPFDEINHTKPFLKSDVTDVSSNENSSNNSTVTSTTAEEHSSEDFWNTERPIRDSLTKEQLISANAELLKKRRSSFQLLDELNSDVKIKIVDLGNGCFDVCGFFFFYVLFCGIIFFIFF